MINKNNPQSMIHGKCSSAHLLTCPLSHFPGSPGFSLLELLAVAAILALAAAVATPIFLDKTDQTRFQRTIETTAEIEKAILGVTSDRVRGDVRFAGYVQDMGELPEFFYVTKKGKIVKVKEDDRISDILKDCKYPPQPKGLWTNDPKGTLNIKDDGLIPSKPYALLGGGGFLLEFIRVGWRGPYLKPPLSGVLEDGWGNPLVFENVDGDFVVISLGADGEEGGEGFDRDFVHTIRKVDYMGSVSGYVSPQTVSLSSKVKVRIYYAPATFDCELEESGDLPKCYRMTYCVKHMETTSKPDGYFRFDGVPIGTQRVLLVVQMIPTTAPTKAVGRGYKLAVEPGTMWLGTLGPMH